MAVRVITARADQCRPLANHCYLCVLNDPKSSAAVASA